MNLFKLITVTLFIVAQVACDQSLTPRSRGKGFVVDTDSESSLKRANEKLDNLESDINIEERNIKNIEEENIRINKDIEKIEEKISKIVTDNRLNDQRKAALLNSEQTKLESLSKKIEQNNEDIASNQESLLSLQKKIQTLTALKDVYSDQVDIEELQIEINRYGKESKRINTKAIERIDAMKQNIKKNSEKVFSDLNEIEDELEEALNSDFLNSNDVAIEAKITRLEEEQSLLIEDIKDVSGKDFNKLKNETKN